MVTQGRRSLKVSPTPQFSAQETRNPHLVKGHTHHRRTVEEGAVTHVTLGSLAPPDAWHAGETYSGTQAGIDGLVVDGRGLGHRLRFAVEER